MDSKKYYLIAQEQLNRQLAEVDGVYSKANTLKKMIKPLADIYKKNEKLLINKTALINKAVLFISCGIITSIAGFIWIF